MTTSPLRCPTCRKDVGPRSDNPHFPFCSDRCRTLDLGRWLDGGYAIPVRHQDEDEDGDASGGAGSLEE
jgi:endogenous inhibitor of DNA gyrase (YacG/DUF329 family)